MHYIYTLLSGAYAHYRFTLNTRNVHYYFTVVGNPTMHITGHDTTICLYLYHARAIRNYIIIICVVYPVQQSYSGGRRESLMYINFVYIYDRKLVVTYLAVVWLYMYFPVFSMWSTRQDLQEYSVRNYRKCIFMYLYNTLYKNENCVYVHI